MEIITMIWDLYDTKFVLVCIGIHCSSTVYYLIRFIQSFIFQVQLITFRIINYQSVITQ